MASTATKKHRKKPLLRFAHPIRRILKVILPEFAISAGFTALVFYGKMAAVTDGQVTGIAFLALLLYSIVEVIFLRRFRHYVKSPTRYFCTNGLAFGLLMLLAVVSAYLNIGTWHTWLFLPFKLFFFPDWMSRIGSAVAVGLLLFLLPILYPPIHRWNKKTGEKMQPKLKKWSPTRRIAHRYHKWKFAQRYRRKKPKRRSLRREITHRYHKWKYKRRHRKHQKQPPAE